MNKLKELIRKEFGYFEDSPGRVATMVVTALIVILLLIFAIGIFAWFIFAAIAYVPELSIFLGALMTIWLTVYFLVRKDRNV